MKWSTAAVSDNRAIAEIAAELGFAKEASVRVALSRALEKRRELLDD